LKQKRFRVQLKKAKGEEWFHLNRIRDVMNGL